MNIKLEDTREEDLYSKLKILSTKRESITETAQSFLKTSLINTKHFNNSKEAWKQAIFENPKKLLPYFQLAAVL